MLDAPTSDVWIDPWVAHLEALGVDVAAARRRSRDPAGPAGGVASATVGGQTVTADHYVAAVPVEIMRLLPARSCAPPSRG